MKFIDTHQHLIYRGSIGYGWADDADYQKEARFVAGLRGTNKLCGLIASCRPEIDTGFDSWLEEAIVLNINGFRRILHVVPDEVSLSETFRRKARKIGKAGLTFDLCYHARQHKLTFDLLKACPDQ